MQPYLRIRALKLIATLTALPRGLLLCGALGGGLSLEAPGEPGGRVSVVGLTLAQMAELRTTPKADLARALQVFTGEGAPDQPAVAGSHAVDEAGLHFRPRFPFVPALLYTVRATVAGVALERTFSVSAPAAVEPQVEAVFPSAPVLPENTLRFYVHFSKPMNPRSVHRLVRLLDSSGRPISDAFVEVEHGLWDGAQKRLTLIVHPGRVKRGLGMGETMGPVLVAGRTYRLVVDGALTDVEGRALGESFEHRFEAAAADRVSPLFSQIGLALPQRGTDSLAATLPEALDEALLRRFVWVEDESGRPVPGDTAVGDAETRWTFRPREAWKAGRYFLKVHPALEDRAGNRFDRLFDRAAGDRSQRDDAFVAPLSLAFSVP